MGEQTTPRIITIVDGDPVGEELPPLLMAVFELLLDQVGEPSRVASAMEDLLKFLCSSRGRTQANCVATDHFFGLGEAWGDVDWEHLPPELGDVLAFAGEALHDTIKSPRTAANFGCTPEQLLEKLRATRLVR